MMKEMAEDPRPIVDQAHIPRERVARRGGDYIPDSLDLFMDFFSLNLLLLNVDHLLGSVISQSN
jgi:hypothetical protein